MSGAGISLPFEGLPAALTVLFYLALFVIAAVLAWTGLLFILAQRVRRNPPGTGDATEYLWVFLVPALNEEVTIRDSIDRLRSVRVRESRIIVIDDGSTDRTGEIVEQEAAIDDRIDVIQRRPPNARRGKAAALNDAYLRLDAAIGTWSRERVIVCVVDADGRLDPDAPRYAAAHFADPAVGGVQTLVRIYNRRHPLTRLQDIEFSIFGFHFQAGRTAWGTAGLGGNGQFNRLAALDDVAGESGAWRDRLTEDQDLALRLIVAGWRNHQELRGTVDQQGLPSLRRLYRQRTRWSQGNLQALAHLSSLWRAELPLVTRIELAFYLVNPLIQAFVGVVVITAGVLAIGGVASFWTGGPVWQLVLFYVLGFGSVVFGCLARGAPDGWPGLIRGYLVAHPYAIYSWIIWPVLLRATTRQLFARTAWTKTQREPLEAPD